MVALNKHLNERTEGMRSPTRNSPQATSPCVELALFRSREAFEAGWRLSPEEACAFAFHPRQQADQSRIWAPDDEDEASETALGFGDF